MKKNKAMRTASGLLVATLLTISMVSGTFAKYTSSDEAGDSATVAKWGVIISTSGSLYGEAYGADSTAVTYDKTASAQTVRVTAAGSDIVAPGTKSNGSGLKFTVNGTPEVKTQIDAEISYQNIYLTGGDWGVMVKDSTVTEENFAPADADLYTKSDSAYTKTAKGDTFSSTAVYYRLQNAVTVASTGYYPVVYTGANVTGKTVADNSLDAVCKAIGKSLNGADVTFSETNGTQKATVSAKTYDANTNLSTTFADLNAAALSWAWTYHTDAATDNEDTILGDLINGLTLTDASVVYRASSTASYADTTTDTYGVVKDSASAEIGGTVTSFNLKVTATQVD